MQHLTIPSLQMSCIATVFASNAAWQLLVAEKKNVQESKEINGQKQSNQVNLFRTQNRLFLRLFDHHRLTLFWSPRR